MKALKIILVTFFAGAFLAGCSSPCPQFMLNESEKQEYQERHVPEIKSSEEEEQM